jgi:hypothetical protein
MRRLEVTEAGRLAISAFVLVVVVCLVALWRIPRASP